MNLVIKYHDWEAVRTYLQRLRFEQQSEEYCQMASPNDEDQDWLPAMEAAQLLARRFHGISRAQQAIAIGLREGILSAGAELISVAEGHEAEFEDEEAPDGELLEIPAESWTRSAHYDSDRLKWDWENGNFDIHNEGLGETYMFEGVHFAQTELESLDPARPPFDAISAVGAGAASDERSARPRGPRPGLQWAAFIEAVLTLERRGELRVGNFSGPGELKNALLIEAKEALSERSIESHVGVIFDRMLERVPLDAKVFAMVEAVLRLYDEALLFESNMRDAGALAREVERRIPRDAQFDDAVVQAVAKRIFERLIVPKPPEKLT